MEATALIISRLDALERNREADKLEAKKDRHEFRNEMADLYNKHSVQIIKLQRAQSAAPANAETKWMKWVLGIQTGIISFLAWLLWGHK